MKNFQKTISFTGNSQQVWESYQDVTNWNKWDKELDSSGLDGDFKQGAKGWLQPIKGPKVKFELVEATEGISFTSKSYLPLATITIAHEIKEEGEKVSITHKVAFAGPLAFFFAMVIGKDLQRSLPQVLQNLINRSGGNLA